MHQFDRHRCYSRVKPEQDDFDVSEPLPSEVRDLGIFWKDEILRQNREEHEADCEVIREILKDKPHWAEAYIAVCLEGMKEVDYARSIGADVHNVSKYLARAEKKLKIFFEKRQKTCPPTATR